MTSGREWREALRAFGILSEEQCRRIIGAAEECGFGSIKTSSATKRGNLHLTVVDQGLADQLWRRIQHNLPPVLHVFGRGGAVEATYLGVGTFEAVGLNLQSTLSFRQSTTR
jgi:hypothetical protein